MENRLNVAFVWHMHQPLYKDPLSGEYTLPWVLYHGTKDYYDMLSILEEFPDVHQTFNLVPCLIEQLNDYGSGNARDAYRRVSAKPARELTREDKIFMLQFFFQSNWDNMVKTVPRYWELLLKRGVSNSREDILAVTRYFIEQDYLDLQVLFNLVWIDPEIRRSDALLYGLFKKGGGYTEDDKRKLLDKQLEIIRMILPKYSEMQKRGIIEVSTTPYFHPIMPLLCDSFSAREAMPNIVLPKERFMHPEDAAAQLKKGVELYKDTFGAAPRGLWPSEGSVSMAVVPLVAGEGFNWMATDEEILTNSLKRPLHRDGSGNCRDPFLYRPYEIDAGGGRKLSMVFRDHVLSDLIGFDYAKMDPEAAADDMVGRLLHVHAMLERPQDHVVSIILDGENAWENFRNDGRDFLSALYSRLSNNKRLRCTTVSEFLDANKSREELKWLFPGSWISHNFKIWIGHVEDNTGWDYIAEARAALVKYQETLKTGPHSVSKIRAVEEAWDEIYAAEGSDWFWWYGEEHSSMSDENFDSLFRRHIKKIYQLIEAEPPESLDIPISTDEKGYRPPVEPRAYIHPVIDGEITNYFEWLSAGRLERLYFGTAMHKGQVAGGLIEGISYGFSEDSLFFRFDYLKEFSLYQREWSFTINFLHPRPVRIHAEVKGKTVKARLSEKTNDKWSETGPFENVAADSVVEIGISFKTLGVKKGDEIRLFISIDAGEKGIEKWPVKGFLILEIPPEDFEQHNWIV